MPYTADDLNHPELQTRIEAAAAFRAQGSAALPELVSALSNAQEEVRWRAAATIGYLGDPAGIPALVAAGHGAAYELKINCVWGLGQIGSAQAIPALVEIIHAGDGESPDIRYDAALALLRLGHAAELHQALHSESEATYRVAHAALAAAPYL
ncbi:MAG: HEAT repeat domain-containing protein [Anaerolineae bacterium]|nr:HEAT repeat domain-containing protein [Anaerolineae bacterium]